MVKIALVDDHILFRRGLSVIINSFEDFKIVFEANNGKDLRNLLSPLNLPSIILLDITMPEMNGYETARWLFTHYPSIKVLALSMLNDEKSIIKMLKNGAKGYILKDSEPMELNKALNSLVEKGVYLNDIMCSNIVHSMNNQFNEDQEPFCKKISLSERELEFVKRVCSDLSYKQIADEMYLSPRTIDGYRDTVFQKLQVSTRIGLVMYAIKNEYVTI
jgi:two-component system, NarL family, invasion response regulator UvrY